MNALTITESKPKSKTVLQTRPAAPVVPASRPEARPEIQARSRELPLPSFMRAFTMEIFGCAYSALND